MGAQHRRRWWDVHRPCEITNGPHNWHHSTCETCGITVTKTLKGRMIHRIRRMAEQNGDFCQYCGVKLTDETRTVDHIIPKSRGGTNKSDNLCLACKTCNNLKGNRTAAEWMNNRTTG